MLKKSVLIFSFLAILTTFYGFNARFDLPVRGSIEGVNEALPTQNVEIQKELFKENDYVISVYDEMIRKISEQEGNDWRLMSAIAYHESRFTADITSRSGAKGLMQIMPSVARQFNVPKDEIANPETNVWLANKLFKEILSTLRLPSTVSDYDRLALVLAAYNGGIGHVSDARRLARKYGEDPNKWEVVSRYLKLKAQPEYYQSEVVKCGRFRGSGQTLAYVDDVMGRYDKYCKMAMR